MGQREEGKGATEDEAQDEEEGRGTGIEEYSYLRLPAGSVPPGLSE